MRVSRLLDRRATDIEVAPAVVCGVSDGSRRHAATNSNASRVVAQRIPSHEIARVDTIRTA